MTLKHARSAWFSALTSFALASIFCFVPAAGVAQTAATVPVASRLTQPIDEGQQVTLKGTVHRLANSANDKGAADEGMALDRMQVVLKRSAAQESALQQTLEDLHTPGTASYHKWMTPAQFGAQFGPSDGDIATISSWLNAHGFTVTKVNPGKQTLEIAGSAGQFQKTFHAAVHKYLVNGQTHYANANDPSIPAALVPVFGGFASLNNFPVRSYHRVLGRATYNPVAHTAKPEWTVGTSTTAYSYLLAPGDFAVQYDLNPLYTAGTKGAGQTIGIINESNISIALVNQYRALFGLPANPPNVIVDGNDPGIDGNNNPDGPNGASIEAYLDVEQAGAVAPGATVDLVIAGDTAVDSGLLLAAQRAVYSDVAPVLSISFGSCEASGGSSFWNTLWEQAAAQGQTVMVSAGDAGSAGCDDDDTQQYAVDGQQVNGMASTPWNVAVGGTDFYYSTYAGTTYSSAGLTLSQAEQTQLQQYWGDPATNASNTTPTTTLQTKIPEQPWNDSQFGLNLVNIYELGDGTTIAGGSGGASNCATGSGTTCQGYSKPAWQTGTGVPADSVRDLPDVSLFAADGVNLTYYPICAADGDCDPVISGDVQISGVGGTSASTPAFAGIMALVNEKYGPQGQANYVLYPLAKQYPTAFNDVTVGTNSVPCSLQTVYYGSTAVAPDDCIAATPTYTVTDPTYGASTEGEIGKGTTAEYNAGAGYDLASGLGTIDANNLVTNWGNVKFATSTVTLTPSQTTFAHGTAITVSGAVTPGTAGGTVALETTSGEPINSYPGQDLTTPFAVTGGAYSGSVNYLPGGTYDIYGSYSGDGTNATSTSAKTSITVTPEASTTSLQALNSTSEGSTAFANGATISYGTQVLLEATPAGTVSAGKSNSPTGTVSYLNGTANVGSSTLNVAGQAEFNDAPPVSTTPYSITAKYSGDASYNASTSNAVTFTVMKDTPVLSLQSGTQSGTQTFNAVSGATTLTVELENEANSTNQNSTGAGYVNSALAPTGLVTITGLPGGTLTFPALTASIDPSTLFVQGVASIALPTETAGSYNITISYPGDGNYAAVTEPASITVTSSTEAASTTTVTASPAALTAQSEVNFNVTVSGAAGKGAPTGTVKLQFAAYYDGPYTLVPATATTSTFAVTLGTAAFLTGQNVVTAQYSGDGTYAPSFGLVTITSGATATYTLGNSGSINVAAGSSGTSSIILTPANFNGTVALSCAVTPTDAASTPTCSLGSTSEVLSGQTQATTPLTVNTTAQTSAGNYVVTITGTSGSLVYTTSVLVAVTAPTVVTTPAIALSNSGAITLAAGGASGTSTITVTPAGGFTGSVALACAVTGTGATAPTCTVTTPVTISGTTAAPSTLTVTSTSSTTAGSYSVTVTGTGTAVTAATTTVAVTVSAVTTTPTVTLGGGSSITIATPGGSGTSAISVTPGGGFTGSVALACAVTATASDTPTCTITTPVAISGTTAGSATLTVSTTAASAALELPRMRLPPMAGGIAAAALLFFLVPMKRRRISTLLGVLVLIAVIGFSAGCGGGGSPTTGGGNSGTPAGNYTVTVSATEAGVTIAPITVAVTVQ